MLSRHKLFTQIDDITLKILNTVGRNSPETKFIM